MSDGNPHHGGSYHRDPKSGELRRVEGPPLPETAAAMPAAKTHVAPIADVGRKQTITEGDGK